MKDLKDMEMDINFTANDLKSFPMCELVYMVNIPKRNFQSIKQRVHHSY